jgi:hypothetical protein
MAKPFQDVLSPLDKSFFTPLLKLQEENKSIENNAIKICLCFMLFILVVNI